MEEFGQFRPVDAPPMRHARLHRALAWLVSLSALGLVLSVPVYLFTNKEAEAVAAPAPVEATVPAVRAADIRRFATPQRLPLNSEVALVFDAREGEVIYEQRADRHRPIASLTKLMTAMVVLDARQRLDEVILIDDADRDRLRGSRSKLAVGNAYTRHDLLASALIASDNRAAAALARTYPGGTPAFIEAMNAKARTLGMAETRFADASGLDSRNISTARDLVRMALAASDYPNIRRLSTYDSYQLTDLRGGRTLTFPNANRLARSASWNIDVGKTGYTSDAGYCLLVQTKVGERPLVIVLLNSWGRQSKYGDTARIRDWLLRAERKLSTLTAAPADPRG
jgi:D-alanyl-D-alanine endopeptidase (penicillin-binding protein 7)